MDKYGDADARTSPSRPLQFQLQFLRRGLSHRRHPSLVFGGKTNHSLGLAQIDRTRCTL